MPRLVVDFVASGELGVRRSVRRMHVVLHRDVLRPAEGVQHSDRADFQFRKEEVVV